MSRRREIAAHIESLDEIAGILTAMKNLALMETQRLAQPLSCQDRLLTGISQAAADFLAGQPQFDSIETAGDPLYLLVGSEQPFCGDYNEQLVAAFASRTCPCIVLGQRLAQHFEQDERVIRTLPAATVSDELPTTLLQLTDTIASLLHTQALTGSGLCVLYHDSRQTAPCRQCLLPMSDLPSPIAAPFPAELQLEPEQLWRSLTEQYLYAALNRILYSALMAENRQRLGQMERALNRLDQRRHELKNAYNAERQEEIIEEIEVIVLSADLLQQRR